MAQPTVSATSRSRLAAIAAITGLVVWTGLHVIDVRSVDALSSAAFSVPWSLPVGITAIAVGVMLTARTWRRRLSGDPQSRPVDLLAAARSLGLAKSCSHAGALLLGAYAGYAVLLVPGASGELRRGRLVTAALTALAAALLVAAGLLLERVLRLPEDDPDETS